MSSHPTALIAPDAFKGSLRSDAVAKAMHAGLRAGGWAGDIDVCLVADGGDGTLSAFANAGPGTMQETAVRGPYGDVVNASWWRCNDGTAVIELARASGLTLTSMRSPLDASSHGTGQLIEHALSAGACQILLACGGSATVDGGVGLMTALGVQFYGSEGRLIDLTPRDLCTLTRIEVPDDLQRVPLLVLTDVSNPLLGDAGAAAVFGPQKGAKPIDVQELERGLTHFAALIEDTFQQSVAKLAGGGAAGGVAAGLAGVLGCELRPGFSEIARRVGLERRMEQASVVLTGEGQIDDQTWSGKTVSGVVARAKSLGLPTWAFGGRVAPDACLNQPPSVELVEVSPRSIGFDEAISRAAELVEAAVRSKTHQILLSVPDSETA